MVYNLYTTIRLRKETKKRLEKILIEYEVKLKRRLDYDELIQILLDKLEGKDKRPELLLELKEMKVSSQLVSKAHEVLANERRLEEEILEGKYSSRYKCTN